MNYKVATSWEELNTWQVRKIAYLFFSNLDSSRLKHRLVQALFVRKPTIWNYYKFWKLVKRVPFAELYSFAHFLNTSDTYTRFPKKLKIGWCELTGPGDRLKDISIDQFSLADLFFYRWSKSREVKELNRLVSVLYTPKGKSFTRDDFKHSSYVRLLPLGTKLSIVLAFIGTRHTIMSSFTNVFPKRKTSSSDGYHSFDRIVISMARGESKPFGGVYQTKEAGLYDFMQVYNEELADYNEKKRTHAAN